MSGKTLKVLVVDDSKTARQMLVALINRSGDMRVLAEAENGQQAVSMAERLTPDIILMDIVMPKIDGLEATRQIMRAHPVPIVLISASLETYETDIAFKAIRAGALTVLQKPQGISNPADTALILNTLRSMAQVKVIHHFQRNTASENAPHTQEVSPDRAYRGTPEIVTIVASTGGPAALSEVLRGLPNDYPLPIVIVQHIAPDFVPSLASWFQTLTRLNIRIAQEGAQPQGGTVYLAPGGAHLRFDAQRCFVLDRVQGNTPHFPSGNALFESAAQVYGANTVAVILTGMGEDGAAGIEKIWNAGGYTIAQDEATSVVYGMPGEAVKRGAARHILPIQTISQILTHLAKETQE